MTYGQVRWLYASRRICSADPVSGSESTQSPDPQGAESPLGRRAIVSPAGCLFFGHLRRWKNDSMIEIKTPAEIALMREAGRVVANALAAMKDAASIGTTML